jgi:hypothetical protein
MTSVVSAPIRDNSANSRPAVTFLDVVDSSGNLLLRTFSTAEAAGFKRQFDAVHAPGLQPSSIEQRVANLAT